MSEQTLNLVELIRQRLQATVRRTLKAQILYGFLLTLGIVAAAWLVSVAVEAGFWLETASRSILFWAILASALGLIGYLLVLPLLRLMGWLTAPSEEAVAARIGERYPDVSDRLTNLLHLSGGRRSDAPDLFVDRAVRMLGEQVHPVPFEQVEDFSDARRMGRWATVPVAGLAVFLIAAPSVFLGASERLLSPGRYYQRPAPFQLTVEPGEAELVRGEPLEVVVKAAGQAPSQITLLVNNLDEDHVEAVQIEPDSAGVYRHTVVNVRKPMRYRVTVDPVETPWYEVAVVERPLVRGLQVALHFPGYTRIPAQKLEPNVGDVSALAGTRVDVAVAVGGQDVEEALLIFNDSLAQPLKLDGRSATGSFVLRQDGRYRVVLRSKSRVENANPITYTLSTVQDAPPAIVLTEPGGDVVLTDALQAPLQARITDDFGFSRLGLYFRLAESRFGRPQEAFTGIPLPIQNSAGLDQDVLYDWLVAPTTGLDPVPGDVIEYYLQVWDNDTFGGPKSDRTEVYRLRMPSLAEQYDAVGEQQDQAQDELEDLLRQTETVKDQFQELRDELRSKQEADWQDQRQIDKLKDAQQSLEDRVDQLTEQVESVTQEMQENNLVRDETIRQYQELQKVMEEINSPELQEALRELQEALEQMNLQQMQESLGKFEFNEQQYQERLERTLELFKKLRMQQEMDEAARRAEELARQQEELAEETGELREEREGERENGREGERENRREEEERTEREGEGKENDPSGEDTRRPEDEEARHSEQNPSDKQEGKNEQRQQQNQDGEQQQNRQDGENNPERGTRNPEQKTPEQLAREQERSREEMRELEKQLEEMARKMEEMRSGPKQEMQKLGEQARQQELSKQMQQNAEQLRQDQLQPAQQGQQQMQQQLQQMQQQLSQMQQGMQGQQKQINLAGLRRALEDVLTLSKEQEALHGAVRALNSDAPQLRDFARQQVELSEVMSVVTDSLQKLSRELPQMSAAVQQQAGEALRAMGQATEAMADRTAAQANGHQQASMMHLNELALLLSDLMNQMMNGQGSGSGMSMQQMMQQLQQMSGQQQQLNQQIQQMLNDMQGSRLSANMQQRLRQMAAQQEAIRKQLQQLARDPAARGKMMGDLNRVADQMEETIRELQRRQVDRPLIERQQQILTRLLDAQKSLQERGKENKREGRSGQNQQGRPPAELPPAEQVEKLRRDLLRALDSGYAPDYEDLIKRYFELLQQEGQPAESGE